MSRPTHVNLTTTARFIGKSLAQTSRLNAAGAFGVATSSRKHGVLVAVAEVERYRGRPISDAELLPKKPRDNLYQLACSIDPGVAQWFADRRDENWRQYLHSRGINLPMMPPPFKYGEPILDHQWFFTRQQVEVLLATALDRRDAMWRTWANSDLTGQAQYPDGPLSFNLNDLSRGE